MQRGGSFPRGVPLFAYRGLMTDDEVTRALDAVAATVRPPDLNLATRSLNAWLAGDLVLAHSLVLDISWGYYASDETPPTELHPVQDELAARRRAARGAIGRPHDYWPPSRYGHLRG